MDTIEALRETFVGRRVLVRGYSVVTCPCSRHRICYWVSEYVYWRQNEQRTCPALWLICPECFATSMLPVRGRLTTLVEPLPVDASDIERLRRYGWLPRTPAQEGREYVFSDAENAGQGNQSSPARCEAVRGT